MYHMLLTCNKQGVLADAEKRREELGHLGEQRLDHVRLERRGQESLRLYQDLGTSSACLGLRPHARVWVNEVG